MYKNIKRKCVWMKLEGKEGIESTKSIGEAASIG